MTGYASTFGRADYAPVNQGAQSSSPLDAVLRPWMPRIPTLPRLSDGTVLVPPRGEVVPSPVESAPDQGFTLAFAAELSDGIIDAVEIGAQSGKSMIQVTDENLDYLRSLL